MPRKPALHLLPGLSAVPAGAVAAARGRGPSLPGPVTADSALPHAVFGHTRYAPLIGLAWLHFVNDGASNFLPGILPAILMAWGYQPEFAGVLMFALVAGQGLQPIAGLFTRFLGGPRLIWLGTAGTAVGMGLLSFTTGLPWLLAVLAFIGLASAGFHPQALATARVYAGRHGHLGLSIMLLGGEIGRGAWPLVVGALVAWGSLSHLWLLTVAILATLPLTHRALRTLPAPASVWHVCFRGRFAATLRLLVYVTFRGLAVIGAMVYLPLLWQSLGGGLVGGASLVTVLMMAGLPATVYGGYLADRIGRPPLLVGAAIAMAAGLALVATENPVALWAGAALTGVAAFASYSVTTLEGQDLYPENRPFGSGIVFGLGNALGAGLAALTGLLASTWSLPGLFWLFAVVALATAPLGLPVGAFARLRPERATQ